MHEHQRNRRQIIDHWKYVIPSVEKPKQRQLSYKENSTKFFN